MTGMAKFFISAEFASKHEKENAKVFEKEPSSTIAPLHAPPPFLHLECCFCIVPGIEDQVEQLVMLFIISFTG